MSEILIDHVLLDRVTKAAKESPRLRMNYNFHESLSSPSQRLLNALELGTVYRYIVIGIRPKLMYCCEGV